MIAVAAATGCDWEDPVEKNLRLLVDPNPAVQGRAVIDLSQQGQRALPRLLETLADPEPLARSGAIFALNQMKAVKGESAQRMLVLLDDPDEAVRSAATIVLARNKSLHPKVFDSLLGLLSGKDENYARVAADLLSDHREEAVARLPRILEAVLSSGQRRFIAQLLGGLGPDAKAAIPVLVDASNDPEACSWAIRALLRIDPAQRIGIPCLLAQAQTELLARMAPESLPALLELLQSQRDDVRASAADALGSMGAAAKEALPALRKALEDPTGFVQTSAKDAIRAIESPRAKAARSAAGPD